jgi:NAD(P)-dependent dehydrogenase (short-subunit alcohol dehydrogenase family)
MAASKQVLLITGCSSGLGYNLVEHFLTVGHNVVATARDVSKVAEFERRFPQTALAVKLDVTDKTSIANAVAKTVEKFGRIDVLINNAAFSVVGAAEKCKEEDMRSLFDTNFFGAVFMTQAVLPVMRKQRSGTIVQISSTLGMLAIPALSFYCASKFALEGFSESLAAEVAPHGIRVVIIETGLFKTKLGENATLPSTQDLDDYDVVKQFMAGIQAQDEKQPGDPAKFAKAIEKIIALENPPLHLPVGEDSLIAIQAHWKNLAADFEKHREIATSTNFDSVSK